MRQNLQRQLSVSHLSRVCGVCPTVLKETFSRYAGQGVMEYHGNLCIEHAKQWLRDGASVSETADALGFSSQSYFAQCFKQKCGYTPMEYKKAYDSLVHRLRHML